MDSNLCAPLFHCYSMNEEELKALSFSISYWSNEELETRVDSFLASVFKSLDNEATRKRALLIIQQLNERLSKYSVGKEDLSCRIDSPSSAKIDHSSHEIVHIDSAIQFSSHSHVDSWINASSLSSEVKYSSAYHPFLVS